MQKQGYRKSTVHYYIRALKSVARKTNIMEPESAKEYLATAELSESRKVPSDDYYSHIPDWNPNADEQEHNYSTSPPCTAYEFHSEWACG